MKSDDIYAEEGIEAAIYPAKIKVKNSPPQFVDSIHVCKQTHRPKSLEINVPPRIRDIFLAPKYNLISRRKANRSC